MCQNSLFRMILNLRFFCVFLRFVLFYEIFVLCLSQLIKININ